MKHEKLNAYSRNLEKKNHAVTFSYYNICFVVRHFLQNFYANVFDFQLNFARIFVPLKFSDFNVFLVFFYLKFRPNIISKKSFWQCYAQNCYMHILS